VVDPVRPDDIVALVAQFEASQCTELHVRFEGFELHLSGDSAAPAIATQREPAARTVAATSSPIAPPSGSSGSPPSGGTGADDLEGLEIVRAPYLGTFYRAPKPGDPVYVEIGAEVSAESDLCLVEVMKLFTAVRAGVAGRVAKVLATDGAMVEAGQPLFAIEPKG
jgi:acetyl-CoA carboxylase biotin carboxyl carrier protein